MQQTLQSQLKATDTTAFDSGRTSHKGRFAVADALRLGAILAVVLNHLIARTHPHFLGRGHDFLYLGTWGVATFFVLSGYLLSAPFLLWIIDDSPRPSTKLFLIRRVLRIVPLYVLAVVFSIVVAVLLGLTPNFIDIVAHLFMLQDFSVATAQTINGPLWTMPVDFEFYLALPVLAFVLASLFARAPRIQRRSLVFVALAIGIVLSLVYRLTIADLYPDLVRNVGAFVYLNNGLGMAEAFLLGIGLALVFEGGSVALAPPAIWTYLFLAAALFGIVARTSSNITNLGLAAHTLLCATSACLLLLALPSIPSVVAFSQTRVVAAGAVLAYAIYLFHYPILEFVFVRLHLSQGNTSFAILSIVSILVLLPVAYVAHRFFEKPFLLLKDKQREGLRTS